MKTIIKNVYLFDELTPEAKKNAWMNSGMDFSDDYSDEYRATLAAFEKAFDIRVYDWSVGGYGGASFRFRVEWPANDIGEMEPLRFARYMWNNYARNITTGKYYSTRMKYENGRYTYKHRHSKILLEMDNCPLTGCVADCDILQPVIDCLHYKKRFSSYDELMEECLYAFFRAWGNDIEHCNSFEYFADAAEANEWYFDENGDIVKGAA